MSKLYIKKKGTSITLIDEKDINDKISNEIAILENQKADKTNATQSNAGLMSAEDKEALDSLDIIGYLNDYDYLNLGQLVQLLNEDIQDKVSISDFNALQTQIINIINGTGEE